MAETLARDNQRRTTYLEQHLHDIQKEFTHLKAEKHQQDYQQTSGKIASV